MVLRPADDHDDDNAYERQKKRSRAYQAGKSADGREIGPLPECEDPALRESMRLDLLLYLRTCHAESFPLPFSDDHLALIQTLQEVILHGSYHAFAMPRGSGKTTIARHAVTWALNYGHRRFVVLIGANNEFGTQLLEQILIDYESNPQLLALFPEICFPLRALEGIRNRCKGQLLNGEPTNQMFRTRLWRLPTVDGAPSSGAVVKSGSPKSAVRGANMIADGRPIRPDFVLIDDPQTRATAESPKAVERLINTINGDIIGCAGAGKSIAIAMPCTVIAQGDAADLLLNRDLHPRWHGTRAKLMYGMPERMDLWEEYWEIYCEALRSGPINGTPAQANQFYAGRRELMDAGALPAWEHRKLADELSAIQHATTLYLADPNSFRAEYQNEPTDPHCDTPQLTIELWRSRITDRCRGVIPSWASTVTAGIDCHKRLLVWNASAWDAQFTGCQVDYGTTPDQAIQLWRVQTARPTLHDALPPNAGDAAALRYGLLSLIDRLATRRWQRDDGGEMATAKILIDVGYERDVVLSAIRESPHRAICIAAQGVSKGENEPPLSTYRKRPGEKRGPEWIDRPQKGLLIDTWYWKSFMAARVAAQPGDPGSYTLFGREADGTRANHTQLLIHLSSEYSTRHSGDRVVDHWSQKPGVENHHFDGTALTFIGGSHAGCTFGGGNSAQRIAPAMSMAEMKRRAAKV